MCVHLFCFSFLVASFVLFLFFSFCSVLGSFSFLFSFLSCPFLFFPLLSLVCPFFFCLPFPFISVPIIFLVSPSSSFFVLCVLFLSFPLFLCCPSLHKKKLTPGTQYMSQLLFGAKSAAPTQGPTLFIKAPHSSFFFSFFLKSKYRQSLFMGIFATEQTGENVSNRKIT